ncbi:ABC transporter permease [Acuticoccus mangrovi]|uniref:ABC transporter permease n=1 Tax=Acuticoccus mangrovi TaxID=2796142 RepID=A0A934MHX9_9HYPH|nr:ABC transporter permease [Acuticoccus mangrovi]MBJ3776576.1 ABC transporter permease [Acuticoccus mangrovi]
MDGTSGLRRVAPLLFIAPVIVLMAAFFALPVADLLSMSFQAKHPEAGAGGFSLVNYAKILGDLWYWQMLGNSLALGFCATLTSLAIGYAVAWRLTHCGGWERTLIALACLLPIFVNVIVGILGWYILMLPFGVIQQALDALGLIHGPLRWLRSFWALVGVLTYEHVPFAVLILAASLQNVPADKIAAARILGASGPRILWTVLLPLSMPGIVASSILVFSLSVSSYLVPILITGPRGQFIPISIYSYAAELLDWNMAGALAFILLVVVVVLTYLFIALSNRLTRRGEWSMV